MKKTLILLTTIFIMTSLVGLWTPWRLQHLIGIVVMLIIAGIGFAVINAASKMILKKKGMANFIEEVNTYAQSSEIWFFKSIILLVVTFVLEFCWITVAAHLNSFVIVEIGYYFLLVLFGCGLSRWCDAKQYVAILAPTILLILNATWVGITFISNPSAQFQYGPEIVIFAASEILGKLTMLPLDIVVTWGAWRIADSTRKTTEFGSQQSISN